MTALLALAVGYLLGARSGRSDLDRLSRALKALYATDEFADVVTAARAQVGTTLHEVAAIIEGDRRGPEETGDLIAHVRNLVGRD
jgi:hypothetical protein